MYAKTSTFVYGELVTSGLSSLPSLLVQEMTRLTAAAMLEAFPNTTMAMPYLPGPGWVTPASVRRAAAFIHAHADQPVALTDIATAAGVTVRALRHAFRYRYDISPAQYHRMVRLERAHLELLVAEPGDGVTVAGVARKWGWASPGRFATAYRQWFSARPGRTLRALSRTTRLET